MKIRLIDKADHNYLDLHLYIPTFIINKLFEEKHNITHISFDTKLYWETEEIGWQLVFKVLGFGICLNRQYSY